MNREVEIKVEADNLDEIRKKISAVGTLVKSVRQIDNYYVPAHRDFFAQRPYPTEWLRLRTNPDGARLEYSRSVNPKPDGDHDYAAEYEIEIKDPETLRQTLAFLDFKKAVTVDKTREYWLCGKIEAALDKVEGLGTYIEAEAKGDFEDDKEAREACKRFLESLGFRDIENSHIKHGYAEMLLGLA